MTCIHIRHAIFKYEYLKDFESTAKIERKNYVHSWSPKYDNVT